MTMILIYIPQESLITLYYFTSMVKKKPKKKTFPACRQDTFI